MRGAWRLVLAVLLAVAGLAVTSPTASACGCTTDDERVFLERAEVVFVGSLLDQQDRGQTRVLTFDVARVYKGEAASVQRLRTEVQSASCGLELAGRGPFVVYADGSAETMTANSCGGTRRGDSVADLGQGVAPRPGEAGPAPPLPALAIVGLVALGAAAAGTAVVLFRRRRSARAEG